MHDGRALSVRRTVGFSTFGGNIFRGLHIEEAKMFFGQFVCDVAPVTCVIYNSPLMHGGTVHEWTSFIAPTFVVVGGVVVVGSCAIS